MCILYHPKSGYRSCGMLNALLLTFSKDTLSKRCLHIFLSILWQDDIYMSYDKEKTTQKKNNYTQCLPSLLWHFINDDFPLLKNYKSIKSNWLGVSEKNAYSCIIKMPKGIIVDIRGLTFSISLLVINFIFALSLIELISI